jgi:hypothetical protein
LYPLPGASTLSLFKAGVVDLSPLACVEFRWDFATMRWSQAVYDGSARSRFISVSVKEFQPDLGAMAFHLIFARMGPNLIC